MQYYNIIAILRAAMPMLKRQKSEWDQDIIMMFYNIGTIIGSHCNCRAEAEQDCIF